MNKRELIDELGEYEVLIHSSWTVPELRSLVIEQHQARELGGRKNRGMAGITKMTLVQLQEEVRKLELDMPAQPTKRLLMRMIRDAATTENNTIRPVGKHKNWYYHEVPRRWAIEEIKTGNSHPDLSGSPTGPRRSSKSKSRPHRRRSHPRKSWSSTVAVHHQGATSMQIPSHSP